jgi:hypothetical protein
VAFTAEYVTKESELATLVRNKSNLLHYARLDVGPQVEL